MLPRESPDVIGQRLGVNARRRSAAETSAVARFERLAQEIDQEVCSIAGEIFSKMRGAKPPANIKKRNRPLYLTARNVLAR
jgi:hypothetical protein